MAFYNASGLTPYHETRHMHGIAQHKGFHEMHATAPHIFPDATLDQDSTLKAIDVLKNNLPLPVLKYIVQLSPKCIEALLVLLNQIQNNIAVDWLTNVVASHDPEEENITVPPTSSIEAVHDGNSFWTNSSATTCHMRDLSNDGGKGLSRQSSNIPNSYNNMPFYYEATLPSTPFHTDMDGTHLADNAMMHPPFGSQFDVGSSFGQSPEHNAVELEAFADGDFILSDTSFLPDFDPEAMRTSAGVFVPMLSNGSESTIGAQTKRSGTIKPRRSRRSNKASKQEGGLSIQMYSVPQACVEDRRSPCPQCDSDFVSHTEFAAHIVAEHDRPTGYKCSHAQCGYVTYRATLLSRHHTNYHKCCLVLQPRGVGEVTPCRHEQHNPYPKRIWGCWLCTWETCSGAESWARHQLEQHKGCRKEDMSHTWLIKSLLSQPRLRSAWHAEIKQLEKATNTVWNLRWSSGGLDPARDALIEALETGLWQGKDVHNDDLARHSLVRAAMAATKETREALDQAFRHEKGCGGKRPLSPAPMSLRRLRSFGQNIRSKLTHEALPSPDTSTFITSPRRQDSLPIRTGGRHRLTISHDVT